MLRSICERKNLYVRNVSLFSILIIKILFFSRSKRFVIKKNHRDALYETSGTNFFLIIVYWQLILTFFEKLRGKLTTKPPRWLYYERRWYIRFCRVNSLQKILYFILYSKFQSLHKSRQSLGSTISHKVTVINSMNFKIFLFDPIIILNHYFTK